MGAPSSFRATTGCGPPPRPSGCSSPRPVHCRRRRDTRGARSLSASQRRGARRRDSPGWSLFPRGAATSERAVSRPRATPAAHHRRSSRRCASPGHAVVKPGARCPRRCARRSPAPARRWSWTTRRGACRTSSTRCRASRAARTAAGEQHPDQLAVGHVDDLHPGSSQVAGWRADLQLSSSARATAGALPSGQAGKAGKRCQALPVRGSPEAGPEVARERIAWRSGAGAGSGRGAVATGRRAVAYGVEGRTSSTTRATPSPR
jgi:hypothetical protein